LINKLLSSKENRKLEFKQELPSKEKLLKTAIAFSNAQGGDLIIGVKDDNTLVGIDEDSIVKYEEIISNTIYDNCSPTIIPEIYSVKVENLERQKRKIVFDSVLVYDVEYTSSLFKAFDSYIKHNLKEIPNIATYEKLRLIKKENAKYYLTNLGIWFSSKQKEFFPYIKIECARFKGISTKEFLDQAVYDEDIISSVENSISFIKRNIKLGATIGEVYRQNRWEYPLLALREIIINAIVHRDYATLGSDIKIAIFDDMIEVTSPGFLLIDKEKLGAGYSELRNPNLGSLLKKLNIIEQWGTGFQKVNEELKNYPEMILDIDDSSQYTQIKFIKDKTTQKTTKEMILILLSQNQTMTRETLAKEIGVSSDTIKLHIANLQKEGRLKRIGGRKNGQWKVLK